MKGLAAGFLVSLICSAPLLAQERDRSLERMTRALQQPPPIVHGVDPVESSLPTTFGIFTFVRPSGRGEMIRVSVPVGELVSRAFKRAAAAKRRHQEAAARRRVEMELKRFLGQRPRQR